MADWACPIDRAPPRKTLSLRFLPPHPSSCDFVVVRGGVSRVFAHSLHSFVGEAGCGGAVVGRGREGREKKEGGKEEERRWCTTVLLNLIIVRSLPPFLLRLNYRGGGTTNQPGEREREKEPHECNFHRRHNATGLWNYYATRKRYFSI